MESDFSTPVFSTINIFNGFYIFINSLIYIIIKKMKIYLENYNPVLLKNKVALFEKYLVNTNQFIEVITENGLYIVDDKDICKINVTLDESMKMEYPPFSFIVDKSKVNLEKVYTVPNHTYLTKIVKNVYKPNKGSKIQFIIEGETSNMNGANFVPTNFYFEAPDNIDLTVCKEDLNVFLSLLN